MDTPYWKKATTLAATLLSAPKDVPGWLRNLPAWGRRPIDLALPWWSYGAIRYLDRYLQPHHRVFEFGSGGSSLFVARRAKSLLAVENDPAWHSIMVNLVAQGSWPNLVCEFHPLADDLLLTFEASTFCRRITSGKWDVVIIDCYCGFQVAPYGAIRPAAFAAALTQINPGGLIVLDDSWMYPDLIRQRAGWEIHNFVGVGPCRYGVTSTAILRRTNS